MRIGIDARFLSYERTGIPVFLHDIIRYWNESNYTDSFILYSNRPIKIDFKLNNNWSVVIDRKPYGTIWTQLCLPGLLKKDNIDVFWEPMHFLPRKVKGIRYFLTVHDLSVLLNKELGSFTDMIFERLFLAKSCERADKIMAISKSTKNDLIKHLKIQSEKIKVIYNGDSPYNHESRKISDNTKMIIANKWKLKSEKYFLFVGTIEPRKNIGTILSAYEYYRDIGNRNEKLVLAGKRGWKSKRFFEQIKRSKYVNDIIVTGFVSEEEKKALYKNAKALLFPSLYEGFGFPVLEAMSVGTLVITSNVSSLPEVGADVPFYLNSLSDYVELAGIMNSIGNLDDKDIEKIKIRGIENSKKFNRFFCAKEIYLEIKNM